MIVDGDGSAASAGGQFVFTPGNNNTAAVDGDGSTATAGPFNNNTAVVNGDGLAATATGDGTTVIVPPPAP